MSSAPIKALIAALGVSASLSEAAVIYNDVDDFVIPLPGAGTINIPIDINNDGIDDFYFENQQMHLALIPFGNNTVYSTAATPPNLGGLTTALPLGQFIGEALPDPFSWLMVRIGFSEVGSTLLFCTGVGGQLACLGEFRAVESYVGLQFETADGMNFGWLRFDSTTFFGFPGGTVRDWAYESQAGVSISAGAIPEPTALSLATTASLLLLLRRKRGCGNSSSLVVLGDS